MARPRRQNESVPSSSRSVGAAQPLVVVCEEQRPNGRSLAAMCEMLGVRVEVLSGSSGLFEFLHYMQPRAVISDLVLAEYDGFDVMKLVADYDRSLPLLMVTSDPVMLGAVDAIEELWCLSNVWRLDGHLAPSAIAEFLYRTGVLQEHDDTDPFTPAEPLPAAPPPPHPSFG
jgi:CheY-like chemotaxis protein